MRLNAKKLISLPVFTQSGEHLGKVTDINLDVDEQAVVEYLVTSGIIKHLNLLIKTAQVKSITAEKMVVDDAALSDYKQLSEQKVAPQTLGSAAMISEK